MPLEAWIPGDFDPCDTCKEQGIAILEVGADDKPTRKAWVVREEFIKNVLDGSSNKELLDKVLKKRMCVMPEDVTKMLGIHDMVAENKQEAQEGEK